MSLHDILMERAALQFPEFRKDYGKGATSSVFDNLSQIALYSSKLAQDRIAKEQEAERVRSERLKSTEQIVKMPTPENTDSEVTYSLGSDGVMDVKRVLKPRNADSLKERREERIASQAELSNATKLRTEFINRPEVKDFITVNTNVNAMGKLLDRALETKDKNNYVAIDQGLITMYNKLTDPASVVRESEYARTPENLPLVNRITGAIGKVQSGGAGLTDDDRKALVEGARIILKERAQPYNQALGEYTDLSIQYGLNPSMVTRGMAPYAGTMSKNVSVDGSAIPTFSTEQEAESANLPAGTIIIINGRRARVK